MKTLKTLTIVAVTGLVGLTALNACPMGGGEKMHEGMKHKKGQMIKMFKQLDLTSTQKDKMQSMRKEMKTTMKEKRAGMQGRGMIGQFVSSNGFDKQGFTQMATQKSQEMIKMRAEMFEKRMNILTPEQRTKLALLIQEKQN
jgi:Spy/CpxP family protein refolding chaperone